MRAVSLHRDVLVVTSAVLQVNCVIVRGGEETFVIDSPVLPDELDALPALLEQAQYPAPSGLLVTHGDWDHLLGRLAFPAVALGCAENTAERLQVSPGEAQRELRKFDEELMIERPRPLALGSLQALPVPGRCEIGDRELELHAADGHTTDGMALWLPWTGVLVIGDYLSPAELPSIHQEGDLHAYLATLDRLSRLVGTAERVVPGHGRVLQPSDALTLLEEDVDYLRALDGRGADASLPPTRRTAAARRAHARNVAYLTQICPDTRC